MARKALIVVDVQNDFCPGGSLAVPKGDQVVAPIKRMLDHATKEGWLIVFSRDWHPRNSKHFAERGGKWPVHCVQGTPGANFHPGLNVADYSGVVISKGTDPEDDGGYSPFDGHTPDGKTLKQLLDENRVDAVLICGLATDYCVKAAALDAVKYGFKTHVSLHACRAVNLQPRDDFNAIYDMHQAGVKLTDTDAATHEDF